MLVVRLRSCWTLTRWGSCGFGVPLLGSLETPVGRRLKINRPNAARLSRLCACCSWPLAAATDTAKLPVFPKGYVFDPRRAFTKNLKKPISRERYDLCESGVSTGDRVGRRHAYWPIADATPAPGRGKVCYRCRTEDRRQRASSSSGADRGPLVIENIETLSDG